MPSLKTLFVGAMLATAGCAQSVVLTGRLQAKSPELGTVYVYRPRSDGGGLGYGRLGSESQAHKFELRSDGLVTNLNSGDYLRVQEGQGWVDEGSFTVSGNGPKIFKVVDGNRFALDGDKWGYQGEFQACTYPGRDYFIYLKSQAVSDRLECHPIGGLSLV